MDAVVKMNKGKEVQHVKCLDLKISITSIGGFKIRNAHVLSLHLSGTKNSTALLFSKHDRYMSEMIVIIA